MAVYLPIQCPVFWEELRRRMRGGRAFITLLIYTAILVLLLFLVTLSKQVGDDPRAWPEFGKTLWVVFLFGQLVVITFISPGLTAGAISAEKEQGTLGLLMLTRMSSFSIVMGKFFGAIGQMLLILFAGLPVISVVFMFGGVSPMEIAVGYSLILVAGIGYASLGFLASCMFSRITAAVAWAYGFMLILLIGFPLGMFLLFQLTGFPVEADSEIFLGVISLNPFVSAGITFFPDAGSNHLTIWPSVISLLILTVLILAECTMMVRRMRGLSKRFIPKTIRKSSRSKERRSLAEVDTPAS